MRIIPVMDVRSGRAVHARAGERPHYQPIRSRLHPDSDPIGLARAYRDRLGLGELYLADLDALGGHAPDLGLYRAVGVLGVRAWVDAGLRGAEGVAALLESGVATVVAGSETLGGPGALRGVVEVAGADRVVFSLDLRRGRVVRPAGADWPEASPRGLAESALRLGVRRLLLLDLSRVGTGAGVGTVPLLRSIRAAWPGAEVAVGGGVAGPGDLGRLRAAGAAAVLVGSALHDGRIGRGGDRGEAGPRGRGPGDESEMFRFPVRNPRGPRRR